MLREPLRNEIRSRLEAAFHDRLRSVLLFGSEARGDAGEGSDVDLLVLLEGPVRLGQDLEAIVEALYPVQMELDSPIHALPVPAETFEAGEYSLYREVKREGVAL
jgi:uncharacterized protein